MKKFLIFLIFIIIIFLVQGVESILINPMTDSWYQSLTLPCWMPPSEVFAPVWIILYILIAISGALLWTHKRSKYGKKAFISWVIALVLNFLWPICFFYFHQILLSAIEITVLIGFIFSTIILALSSPSKLAGWILIPYLLWVIYAAVINWSLVFLN